jgi:DNA-binding LacI/PurR family transcriptional regulator
VPYGRDSARVATNALLDDPHRPTALVLGSDLLAVGALQVLYERRLRIPDNLSVVSIDDTLGSYMAPPLTEAEPQTEEMGRQAVELIIQQCQRTGARGRATRHAPATSSSARVDVVECRGGAAVVRLAA